QDYGNTAKWERLDDQQILDALLPNFGNLTKSDGRTIGGQIVYNELLGGATADVMKATVTANGTSGDISIGAHEQAQMDASEVSNISTSGGSTFGEGKVLAANGQAATNTMLGSAKAFADHASLTAAGSVAVAAANTAAMNATVLAASTTSGGGSQTSGSFSIAFNSIGWVPQNILFNTI